MTYCPQCGTKALSDNEYCGNCGGKLRDTEQVFPTSQSTGKSPGRVPPDNYSRNNQEKKQGTSWTSILGVFSIVFVIAFLFSSGGFNQILENISPPSVRIISTNSRSGFEGFNFVVYLDVEILCETGSGNIEVWSYIDQDSSVYQKYRSIHVSSGQTYRMTFSYPEATFWSLTGQYRVWIEQ